MVRSAYRMLWETKRRGQDLLSGRASSSDHTPDEKGWSSLWQTKVPSRIRSFLWRLARQSLPTEDVRQHRNMSMMDNCQLCGNIDSWRHSLIECSMARCLWALADETMVETMMEIVEPNAKHWLFEMQRSLSHAQFMEA